MSEKRLDYIILSNNYYQIIQEDTDCCKRLAPTEIIRLLNSLNDENRELRQQLQEMKSDEKLYAQEIVKLNKEAKEVLNFRNLGSDY